MKIAAIILLGLLTSCIGSQAQSPKSNYTGKATVAGLGKIAFPEGDWSLEFQRIQAPTNSLYLPDYFVFKRSGERLERLTLLRYPPTTTPRTLAHMLDTVAETMGDGIPLEERKEYNDGGEIHAMRMDPASPGLTERTIAFSFIHDRPSPAPSWLCHSYLFLQDGSAFVIAHASTSVISPEAVHDVQFLSQFFPSTNAPRSYE